MNAIKYSYKSGKHKVKYTRGDLEWYLVAATVYVKKYRFYIPYWSNVARSTTTSHKDDMSSFPLGRCKYECQNALSDYIEAHKDKHQRLEAWEEYANNNRSVVMKFIYKIFKRF